MEDSGKKKLYYTTSLSSLIYINVTCDIEISLVQSLTFQPCQCSGGFCRIFSFFFSEEICSFAFLYFLQAITESDINIRTYGGEKSWVHS